jgi:hypothetical protein
MKDLSIKVIDLQQYSIKSEKTSFCVALEHSFFFDEGKKKEKARLFKQRIIGSIDRGVLFFEWFL